jgi:hypothetical protein
MGSSSGFYDYIVPTGLIVPDTQTLKTAVQGEFTTAFGSSLILTDSSPQGVLINAEVLARTRTLQLSASIGNQINPNYAGGVFLDSILALTGSQRTSSSFTIVPIVVTGITGVTIPQGSVVQDISGNMYATIAPITIDGITNGTVQAVASGALLVSPNTITTIISNTIGWETVNNVVAQSSIGSTDQSDVAARTLRLNTLALQGDSLSQAITSGVNAVPGVTSLFYQQNDEPYAQTLNNVPMVANSLYVCVDGGDPASIASILNQKKSGGCAYNNSLLYTGTGTTVGSFNITGSLTGSFTIAGAVTTASSVIVTVSSTSGVFLGQTISGTGIPAGAIVISFVANTSITMNVQATANGTVTVTMGASPVITSPSSTANVFVGQTIIGTSIPAGTTVVSFVASTSITMSQVATASESGETITMGATPFVTGVATSTTQTGTTTGTFTASGTTEVNSNVVDFSSTAGMFVGQTITGTGIPTGSIITAVVPNVAVILNFEATATGSATMTLGASPVISGLTDTSQFYVGQSISGSTIPSGAIITQITINNSVTMSVPALAGGTPTITFNTTPFYIGGGITDSNGYIPAGTTIVAINGTTLTLSNLVTGSGTDLISVYGGIPQDVEITDPYSGQVVDVLFDQPAYVPIAVQITVKANSALSDIITNVKNAIIDYATGNVTDESGMIIGNDPGLKIGVAVSCFEIAGAVNIEIPSLYIVNVQTALLSTLSFSNNPIPIQPFQRATIVPSSIAVILV